jgi:geranylgeranyl pyrophosphate synthase
MSFVYFRVLFKILFEVVSYINQYRLVIFRSSIYSGEFMQLSTKESDAEQFQDYLNKTFCKTASLFANTCKAVSDCAFDSH